MKSEYESSENIEVYDYDKEVWKERRFDGCAGKSLGSTNIVQIKH